MTPCDKVQLQLGRIPQYIIYFFNRLEVRNRIIDEAIIKYDKEKRFTNFGTINIRINSKGNAILVDDYDLSIWNRFTKEDLREEEFDNMLLDNFIGDFKQVFQLKPKTVFTVCIHYNQYNVHYLSFVYDKKIKDLISFDPGVEIYPEGQIFLLPAILKAFRKHKLLSSTSELGSTCNQYRFIFKDEPIGIQWNGKNMDAFCQTHTLFFLREMIKKNNIVRKVCRLLPENREVYLFEEFIIPILKENPYYIFDIIDSYKSGEGITENLKLEKVFELIEDYAKKCKKKTCPLGSQLLRKQQTQQRRTQQKQSSTSQKSQQITKQKQWPQTCVINLIY